MTRRDGLLGVIIGMPLPITWVKLLVWTDQQPSIRGKLALATMKGIGPVGQYRLDSCELLSAPKGMRALAVISVLFRLGTWGRGKGRRSKRMGVCWRSDGVGLGKHSGGTCSGCKGTMGFSFPSLGGALRIESVS